MAILKDAPLIEAILEIRWGEQNGGVLSFSQEEQLLLPGRFSSIASQDGFAIAELVNQIPTPVGMGIPQIVAHRFRKAPNSWPCFQIGLGIFTVNQVNEGYSKLNFFESIRNGVALFNKAAPNLLESKKNGAQIILRYQDGYYPKNDSNHFEFLKEHFNISADIAPRFLDSTLLKHESNLVRLQFEYDAAIFPGKLIIAIVSADINGRPAILVETIVQSKLSTLKSIDDQIVLDWVKKAHKLQKHTFESLVKPSAYQQ